MKNRKGLAGFIGLLLLLIIGVVIGAVAVNLLDNSDKPVYNSQNYQQEERYDYDYQDIAYDNYQEFPDYYSDTHEGYTENYRDDRCGYLNEPCCEGTIERDPWGSMYVANRCQSPLECRGGYCVEGPEYEAYARP